MPSNTGANTGNDVKFLIIRTKPTNVYSVGGKLDCCSAMGLSRLRVALLCPSLSLPHDHDDHGCVPLPNQVNYMLAPAEPILVLVLLL